MRIGLDARCLTMPRPRGTGRNLLDAYRLIPTLRPEWEFVLYHQRPLEIPDGDPSAPWHQPNVRLCGMDMPGDRFDAWFQIRLPLAATRDGIDLLHYPASVAPLWRALPFVVTVHDLIPLKLPGELPPAETTAFRRGVQRAVRRAAHIITVSNATYSDLHQTFGVPLDRMTVIPWAADSQIAAAAQRPLDPAELGRIRQEYGLTGRWLLNFSGAAPRKNAEGLLAAFAQVPPAVRGDVELVLVGCEPETCRRRLMFEATRRGIATDCHIFGFVPPGDLPTLLRGARGLLLPSRYEGFGLPILDAFVCGVPVLAAHVSSMPEVAGPAAVYCDPENPGSIAAGITQLLDDTTAADLVRRGYERGALFDWHGTAEAMCTVYELAAGRRRLRRGDPRLEACTR